MALVRTRLHPSLQDILAIIPYIIKIQVLTSEQFEIFKDYKDSGSTNALLMYIKCGANEYRIFGSRIDGEQSISVTSILKKNDGKYVDGNIVRVEENIRVVKEILELRGDVTTVKVDDISDGPFEDPVLRQQPTTSATATQQDSTKEDLKSDNGNTDDQPGSGAKKTSEHGVTGGTQDQDQSQDSNDTDLSAKSDAHGSDNESNQSSRGNVESAAKEADSPKSDNESNPSSPDTSSYEVISLPASQNGEPDKQSEVDGEKGPANPEPEEHTNDSVPTSLSDTVIMDDNGKQKETVPGPK